MTIRYHVRADVTGLTITVSGRLQIADTAPLRVQMLKCLAEQPGALLCDLTALRVDQPLALSVFTAVARQAARWPGVPVLLCAAPPRTRAHLLTGACRRLPLFESLAAAHEHLGDDRLAMPSISEELLPVCGATRHARDVVTGACLRWELPELVGPASLIVTELVANVVDHAHTMMGLRVSLRERYLNLAVRDGCATQPVLPGTDRADRHGLLLVDAIADAWGSLPSEDGKVVWAALRR